MGLDDGLDITIDGFVCSLSEPFTLKLAGDNNGGMTFTPSSDEAGNWSFTGRVANAPFPAHGNGSYTVACHDDGPVTSIDFESTIRMAGGQRGVGRRSRWRPSRGGPPSGSGGR